VIGMQRTYLPRLGAGLALALAGASGWLGLGGGQPASQAASLFNSLPLEQSRFAVLAQPVGRNDWKLLVLEQIRPEPRCWQARPDGLIDPTLNRFDFTGICSRYIDSNGYSLRVGGSDLGSSHRLRLKQEGNRIALVAISPSDATELPVGQGLMRQRDRDGFVLIQLEPDWRLQRRAFGSQTLSHVYLANEAPLAHLIARANHSGAGRTPQGQGLPEPALALNPPPTLAAGQGPVSLPVVPYRP
jgi:hypothetical protein